MKKLMLVVIFVFVSSIFASENRAKFYDFSELNIDGNGKKPEILSIKDKKKTTFNKILNLNASFISQIEKSTKDISIK